MSDEDDSEVEAGEIAGALGRLFRVVEAEIRANPAFAAAIAKSLSGVAPGLEAAARAPRRPAAPAPAIDPVTLYNEAGADGLRDALEPYSRAELLALIRARDLSPKGISSFNKARLVEHIAGAARRAARARASPLDY